MCNKYYPHIRQNTDLLVKWNSKNKEVIFMFNKKTKLKLTDFECNLLINRMNKFRNMLLAEDLPTEDVDELLLKIIDKSEK